MVEAAINSQYTNYYGAYEISENGVIGQVDHEMGDKISNSYGISLRI